MVAAAGLVPREFKTDDMTGSKTRGGDEAAERARWSEREVRSGPDVLKMLRRMKNGKGWGPERERWDSWNLGSPDSYTTVGSSSSTDHTVIERFASLRERMSGARRVFCGEA